MNGQKKARTSRAEKGVALMLGAIGGRAFGRQLDGCTKRSRTISATLRQWGREWVEDCLHRDYSGAPVDGSAWLADGDCNSRMMRSGSWSYNPGGPRSACGRSWISPYANLKVGVA